MSGPEREANCQRVAIATVGTIVTGDVIVAPPFRFDVPNNSSETRTVELLCEWGYGVGFDPVTPRDICNQMQDAGDGAVGIISVQWPPAQSRQPGQGFSPRSVERHVANVLQYGGVTFLIDSQAEGRVKIIRPDDRLPLSRGYVRSSPNLLIAHDPRSRLPVDELARTNDLLAELDSYEAMNWDVYGHFAAIPPHPSAVRTAISAVSRNGFDSWPEVQRGLGIADNLLSRARSLSTNDLKQQAAGHGFPIAAWSSTSRHNSDVQGNAGAIDPAWGSPDRRLLMICDGRTFLTTAVDNFVVSVDLETRTAMAGRPLGADMHAIGLSDNSLVTQAGLDQPSAISTGLPANRTREYGLSPF